jgi:hypothetical protein
MDGEEELLPAKVRRLIGVLPGGGYHARDEEDPYKREMEEEKIMAAVAEPGIKGLGVRIAQTRVSLKLTRNEAGARCFVTRGDWRLYEDGSRLPSAIIMLQIALGLGEDIHWLVTGESFVEARCEFRKGEDMYVKVEGE